MPLTTLNSHQIQLNTEYVRTLSDANQPHAQMGDIEQDMIAGFENCTQKLIKLLDGSGNDDAINRIRKFNITTAEKLLTNSYSPMSLKVELPKIYADLHKLVNLATDEKLALTARQLAIVQRRCCITPSLGRVRGVNLGRLGG